MSSRSIHRVRNSLGVSALAILLAVPAPIGTCCRAALAAATHSRSRNCCHGEKIAAAAAARPTLAKSNCAIGHIDCQCVCCRPVQIPVAPTNSTSSGSQTDVTAAFAAIPIFFIPANVGAGIASEPLVASATAAIPHRILHCSWII